MGTTQITIRYGGTPWHHDRGGGRLEFGRATRRGIIVLPRNPALTDYLHGVCGWFSWDNGWSLRRRPDTGNISMHAHLGRRVVEVSALEPTLLGVGDGRVEMVLRGPGQVRESIELHWSIPSSRADESEDLHRSMGTLGITDTFEEDDRTRHADLQIVLAPREREVMAVFAEPLLRGEVGVTLTSRDVAWVLFRDPDSTPPVVRALDRVKTKVAAEQRRLHEPVVRARQGVRSSDVLARWLVDHGVLTLTDVERLPQHR